LIAGVCRLLTRSGHRRPFRGIGSPADGGACHFVIIIVIGHETTAAAPWALLFIVRTLFNDAFAIAVWTGFHVRLSVAYRAILPVVGLR
jgi:hypothetical protein